MSFDKNYFEKKPTSEAQLALELASSINFLECTKISEQKEAKLFYIYIALIKYCRYLLMKNGVSVKYNLKDFYKLLEAASQSANNEDLEAIGKKILNDYSEILNSSNYEIPMGEVELLSRHLSSIVKQTNE